MHKATGNDVDDVVNSDKRAGLKRRRRVRLASAAAAAGLLAMLGPVGGASAAECSAGTILRLLCGRTAPIAPTAVPTTSPTPAPALAAPLPAVPPVPSLPPVPVSPLPATGSFRSVPDAARRLLELANDERRRAGVGPLAHRDDVAAIALAHSNKMAQKGDIFHSDSYFSAATRAVLGATTRGENVALNPSIDDAHARLMRSPGHRSNILEPRFSVAGFAVVQAPDGQYFITQDFLQPSGAPAPVVARAARTAPAASRGRQASQPAPLAAPATAASSPPPQPPAPSPAPLVDTHTGVVDRAHPVLAAQITPRPDVERTPLAAGAAVLLLATALTAVWAGPRRGRTM